LTPFHRLPQQLFDELAAGSDGVEVVRALQTARHSKHLLLLRAVLDAAARYAPAQAAVAGLHASFEALGDLERVAPGAVTALISHPHVGAWAALCLRRLRGTGTSTGLDVGSGLEVVPIEVDLAHLGAVAAAVAVFAEASVDVVAPARAGSVALPTLGRLHVDAAPVPAPPWQLVTLYVNRAGVAIDGGTPVAVGVPPLNTPRWEAVRRLRVEAGGLPFEVALDDLDPYRDCHGLGASSRLAVSAYDEWHRHLADAWRILVTRHPARAEAVEAGLTVLVPISPAGRANATSATSADAVGAVALTPPVSGLSLAATLVHEFQHTKLSALFDLVPLFRPIDGQLFYSPWRDDPRPLAGLLHGVFAFFGVADFWRAERHHTGPTTALADFEFARILYQMKPAQRELLDSGRLTAAGARLARTLAATVDGWRQEPLSAEPQRLAADLATNHRAAWRLRNLIPDPAGVRAIAAAWRAGDPAPPVEPVRAELVTAADFTGTDLRLPLARWRATAGAADTWPAELRSASEADRHLARGDYPQASQAFLAEIGVPAAPTVGSAAAWAGLAVAAHRLGHRTLAERPELVRAVHDLLRPAVTPIDLAAWLTEPH
jgi:HEXXH motif-containing protein